MRGKCTKEREKEVGGVPIGNTGRVEHYVCKDEAWKIAEDSDIVEQESPCAEHTGEYMSIILDVTAPAAKPVDFICDGTSWREPDSFEVVTKQLCYEKNENLLVDDFVCENGKWRNATEIEKSCGACSKESYNETCFNIDADYICEDNSWRVASDVESVYGLCMDSVDKFIGIDYGADIFGFVICKSDMWERVTSIDDVRNGICFLNDDSETWYFDTTEFICQEGVWTEVPEVGN